MSKMSGFGVSQQWEKSMGSISIEASSAESGMVWLRAVVLDC